LEPPQRAPAPARPSPRMACGMSQVKRGQSPIASRRRGYCSHLRKDALGNSAAQAQVDVAAVASTLAASQLHAQERRLAHLGGTVPWQ
jgi:hypothetical protein